MIKIGSHCGMKAPDYMLGSVKEALGYGATCLMIYTGAPQNTKRTEIDKLKVDEARKLLDENAIDTSDVLIHAPYIVNLANPEEEKRKFAIDFLSNEYKRTAQMGAKFLIIHPGAHLKQGAEIGTKHISNGLNQIIDENIGTVICLETMAGKGTEVGRTFEELKSIIDGINSKEHIGVCLDTCHIHDAGYDLSNFDSVLDEFDKVIGLEYLKCLHINGSKNERGASKDRHANLGEGFIDKEILRSIVQNSRISNIPKVLETPYVDGMPPYKEEIEYLIGE